MIGGYCILNLKPIDFKPRVKLTKKQLRIYLNTYNDEPDNIKKYAEYLAIISYNQVYPNKFQVKKHLQLKFTNIIQSQLKQCISKQHLICQIGLLYKVC